MRQPATMLSTRAVDKKGATAGRTFSWRNKKSLLAVASFRLPWFFVCANPKKKERLGVIGRRRSKPRGEISLSVLLFIGLAALFLVRHRRQANRGATFRGRDTPRP